MKTSYDRSIERPQKQWKMFILYFSVFYGTFFLLPEQRGSHFHFALGPENYVVGPAWDNGSMRSKKEAFCSVHFTL